MAQSAMEICGGREEVICRNKEFRYTHRSLEGVINPRLIAFTAAYRRVPTPNLRWILGMWNLIVDSEQCRIREIPQDDLPFIVHFRHSISRGVTGIASF